MENSSPRLWTYTPSNSPVALPKEPLFFNSGELLPLMFPDEVPQGMLSGQNLQQYCSAFTSEKGTVDDLLSIHEGAPMSQRRPFLLLGELANPYRLQDIGVGPMPIFTVRITGLCRTYADALDNREVVPGVHHITLARTDGWWEKTDLTSNRQYYVHERTGQCQWEKPSLAARLATAQKPPQSPSFH